MPHTIIRPYPESYGRDLSYCQAIRAGNQIFMMGQVSWDLDGKTLPNEPGAQADQAMRNIKHVLEDSGSKLEHIVKATVYVTDVRHREAVYGAMAKWMKGIHYCSTGVTVTALARPEWVVEIDVHAVIPDDEA